MRLRVQHIHAAAPAEVFAMLIDPGYRERVCRDQGALSVDVEISRTDSGATVVVDQTQPVVSIPAFAASLIGPTTRTILREHWADPANATLQLETPGKPATIAGTVTLHPDGAGTRAERALEIRVDAPLVGGRIEKVLAEVIRRSIDAEFATAQAWLAG